MNGLSRFVVGSSPIGIRIVVALIVAGGLLVVGIVAAIPMTAGADEHADRPSADPANVTEEAYADPVPEPGDEYYEAIDPDGNWISYSNPRDAYRDPYLGDGSGKLCVTLVNEAGEPIVGETVPNTTVTIPTGDELEWHPHADPMVVEYPLTDHYDRPLDGDQFGTTPDLPQGDGYLDTHCIEMHGQPEDATIEYGEAQLDGDHAADIDVVGYVQQANTPGWDTDVDPIEDAASYEETGGWTFESDASHGQAVVVLQLDRDGTQSIRTNGTDDTIESNETDNETETSKASTGEESDGVPGFGSLVAVAALVTVAVLASRR